MAIEQLLVRLRLESGQYKTEAKQAAQATDKIATSAKTAAGSTGLLQTKSVSLGSTLRGFAVTGGILAVASGLRDTVLAAEEAAAVMAVTEQVIKTTGGVANVTAEDVDQLSSRLAALVGIDDEIIKSGANVLLTFRNIRNEVGEGNKVFDRALSLLPDINEVMGTDIPGAAKQLGKALQDPVGQMTALSRAGLTFSDQQKDQIRSLVENNDLLGAQTLILDELETQLGGTAAAGARASDKLGVAFGEIGEAIGEKMLPFVEVAAIELQDLAGMIDELDKIMAQAGIDDRAVAFLTHVEELATGFSSLSFGNRGMIEQMQALADTLSPDEIDKAISGLDLLQTEFGLTAGEISILQGILLGAKQQVDGLVGDEDIESLNRYGRKAKDTAGDVDDLGGAIDDQAGAFGNNERAIDRTVRQLGNYEDALRRLIDPVFKAIDDQNNLRDAQAAYTDAVEEFGPNSQPAIDAGFDLAEAQLAVNESAQNLPDDMQGATDSIILLGQQAGLSEYQLRLMDTALSNLDGRRIDIELAINRTGAPINPNTILGAEIGARQHGGPVMARTPYIVGERGPELFVPYTSGTVIPNALQGTGGGSGGTTTHIHIGTVYGWDDFVRKVNQANVDGRRLGIAN